MNREKELLLRMTGTIVTIVLCLAAMGFSAFAYFSHSVSSGMNVIQSAHFDVIVTDVTGVAEETDASGDVVSGNTYVCSGEHLQTYTFTIEHAGTAETGYCKIEILDKNQEILGTFYTEQMFKNEENGHLKKLTLKIEAANGYTIKFTPQWGTSKYYLSETETLYSGDLIIRLTAKTEDSGDESGDETVSGTDHGTEDVITHTVASGETLTIIAQKYNTTVDALVAYNHIANADNIEIEQVIKIPPAGWWEPDTSSSELPPQS